MADDANEDVTDEDIRREEDQYYKVYSDYSRTLRAWFVAYGVGGPVLFLTQEPIAERIRASGSATCIISLFLAGVVVQVFLALTLKWVLWYMYATTDPLYPRNRYVYELVNWISRAFGLGIILDLFSFIAFSWATLWVLLIFVGS